MVKFEIDVSGEDILNEDFAIAVVSGKDLIYGYKTKGDLVNRLIQNYNSGRYRYKGKKGKKNFKIRFYSLIIYSIFKKIIKDLPKIKKERVSLKICRDFYGRENDIKSNLIVFLKEESKLKVDFHFCKLSKDSLADRYAHLYRKDIRHQLPNSVNLDLKKLENYFVKNH